MKLYLAGPDVFHPDALAIGEEKKRLCAEAGAIGLFPLDGDLEVDVEHHPKRLVARAIFEACLAQLEACDAVLANFTPFRGPSADVGTVWEAGWACARGKKVFAYSNSAAPFAQRTRELLARAPDGLTVEDFDGADNLMLTMSVTAWFAKDAADPWRDFGTFRQALAAATT